MASEPEAIGVETAGAVRVFTMRQEKLDIPAMTQLTQQLLAAASGDEVGAVVLTGRGESFCRGGDLGDITHQSSTDVMAFGEAFIGLHRALTGIDLPVIAAVNGAAYGGGLALVEACDLAVAGRSATFSVPEIRFGLAPMMALVGVRRLACGRKPAMYMAMTGETVAARRALELGWVNQLVDDDRVVEVAVELGRRLARQGRVAMRLTKAAYRAMDEGLYERQLRQGLAHLVVLLGSREVREGGGDREKA